MLSGMASAAFLNAQGGSPGILRCVARERSGGRLELTVSCADADTETRARTLSCHAKKKTGISAQHRLFLGNGNKKTAKSSLISLGFSNNDEIYILFKSRMDAVHRITPSASHRMVHVQVAQIGRMLAITDWSGLSIAKDVA